MKRLVFVLGLVGCHGSDATWTGFVMATAQQDMGAVQGIALATFSQSDPDWSYEPAFSPTDTCGPADDATTAPTGGGAGKAATPGDVVVSVGSEDVPMGSTGFGSLTTWEPGASLGLTTTGGQVPALDVAELMALPAMPEGQGTVGDDGTYQVTWTPDGGDVVLLDLEWPSGSVRCTVEDDGEFTVSLADQLGPANEIDFAVLQRTRDGLVDADDGDVQVYATALVSGSPL